jgi:hypothetical protein
MRVAPDSAALELRVLFGAEAKPDGASTNLDAVFDGGAVSESALRAEALIHFADFVGVGEGQFQRQRGAAVGFKKADVPAVAEHKVHADAVFIDAADSALLGEVHGHEDNSIGERKAK